MEKISLCRSRPYQIHKNSYPIHTSVSTDSYEHFMRACRRGSTNCSPPHLPAWQEKSLKNKSIQRRAVFGFAPHCFGEGREDSALVVLRSATKLLSNWGNESLRETNAIRSVQLHYRVLLPRIVMRRKFQTLKTFSKRFFLLKREDCWCIEAHPDFLTEFDAEDVLVHGDGLFSWPNRLCSALESLRALPLVDDLRYINEQSEWF